MQGRRERAARNRASARELRHLAERVATPEARAELLDLAERFERLAARIMDDQPTPEERNNCGVDVRPLACSQDRRLSASSWSA